MNFLEFIFNLDNYVFTGSLILMVMILFVEVLMLSVGLGISEMVDSMIPDLDSDLYIDEELTLSTLFIKFFAWLRVKRVPSVILFVVFLTSFGVIGLVIQSILLKLTGVLWFSFLVMISTLVFSLIVLRITSGFIEKIIPCTK